jgi:hypothetical protein
MMLLSVNFPTNDEIEAAKNWIVEYCRQCSPATYMAIQGDKMNDSAMWLLAEMVAAYHKTLIPKG